MQKCYMCGKDFGNADGMFFYLCTSCQPKQLESKVSAFVKYLCPTCGGGFDAPCEKSCPWCGRPMQV